MAEVPTARGDSVDTSELGFTLMTEMVIVATPDLQPNWPDQSLDLDGGSEELRVQQAVDKLNAAKATAGVDTIVDRVLPGVGRNVARVKRVAEGTDVNIVVATGWYSFSEYPFFFDYRERFPHLVDPSLPSLEDLFVRDIEEGIAGTGVRAGILKVATDRAGLTEGVERLIRATARAHRRTGAPITTHTGVGIGAESGLLQQQVFAEEGVDLSRVLIGHVDYTPGDGLEEIQRLIDAGSFIGMDTLALADFLGNRESRIARIAELCERGHADQIVLSHDQACFADLSLPEPAAGFAPFTEVALDLVPKLRERGVTDAQIHQMTVENPARIFATRALGPY